MLRKLSVLLALAAIAAASLACQFVTGPRAASEPPTAAAPTATAAPSSTTAPLPTVDTAATQQAEAAIAKATQEAAARAAEQAEAEKAAAEATAQAAEEMALTAEVEAQATQQAEGIFKEIIMLEQAGDISRTEGTYLQVEDFEESWAQIGWYQWWNTGYAPTDFVIRAHTAWESASRTSDWFNTGCGFVFHAQDENNHYLIYLAMDGYVYMKGYVDGKFRELGREYYGKVQTVEGEADVLLAVDGAKITYYVNGEKIFQRENKELPSGDLALTLSSGTNKDFGTRCTISDIEIWDMTR